MNISSPKNVRLNDSSCNTSMKKVIITRSLDFTFNVDSFIKFLFFFNILPDKIEKLPFFIFQRLVSLIHQVNGKLIVVPSSTHDLNNTGTIY